VFSKPAAKPAGSTIPFGVKPTGTSGAKATPIGGGGFVIPAKTASSAATTGAYKFPTKSYGVAPNYFASRPAALATTGYGSKYGTSFSPATQYVEKKGFSKKAVGMGVAAGFVGGAAVGVAGTKATYGVYHRYKAFKNMMKYRGFRRRGYHHFDHDDDDYYGYDDDDDDFFSNSYYNRNECLGGCPENSHCEWGICECNFGTVRRYGRCKHPRSFFSAPRSTSFDPHKYCGSNDECQKHDMNLVCYKNATSKADEPGKCQCKPDMAWNKKNLQCEIFIGVDCSKYTYQTQPSKIVLEAVDRPAEVLSIINLPKTNATANSTATNSSTATAATTTSAFSTITLETTTITDSTTTSSTTEQSSTTTVPISIQESQPIPFLPGGSVISNSSSMEDTNSSSLEVPEDRTPTMEESLKDSLLAKLDKDKATESEMEEAFCRDVDSFSFDLNQYDGKPPSCEKIPSENCAVVYDSHDCGGGWKLYISSGQINFPYFSSYWKYRNDIDLVGVRAGCSFTGFSGSGFVGKRETIKAGEYDVWVVLGETSNLLHLDEDIESIMCSCNY